MRCEWLRSLQVHADRCAWGQGIHTLLVTILLEDPHRNLTVHCRSSIVQTTSSPKEPIVMFYFKSGCCLDHMDSRNFRKKIWTIRIVTLKLSIFHHVSLQSVCIGWL